MAGPFSVQSATREVAKNTQLEQFAVGGVREEAPAWLTRRAETGFVCREALQARRVTKQHV